MTEPTFDSDAHSGFGRWRTLLSCALLACGSCAAQARELTIGVVYAPDDARYASKRLEKSFPGQPLGRPKAGAEVAIAESEFQLANAGLKIALQEVPLDTVQQARTQIVALAQKGVRHFLLDLPGPAVAELSKSLQSTDVVLFNVSAPEDNLRRAACSPNLFHTLPDESMMADATAQFLTAHKWTRVLLLTSTAAADAARISATRQAIKRYGIKVVADKIFKLSNDPRERELGNVALLTAGIDADVVWVVDADGEFARDVPYRVNLPRAGGRQRRTGGRSLANFMGALRCAAIVAALQKNDKSADGGRRLGCMDCDQGDYRGRDQAAGRTRASACVAQPGSGTGRFQGRTPVVSRVGSATAATGVSCPWRHRRRYCRGCAFRRLFASQQ